MLRFRWKWTLGSMTLVLALTLAVAGCGESDSFMPPPIPELDRPAAAPAVKIFELVLPPERTADRRLLAQLIRLLASREKVSFRVVAPDPKDPPRRQAELIRKAVAGGASVLIVDPASDPEVAQALEEARAGNVPCVLLGRLGSEPAKPFPTIESAPYDSTAGKLIEALIEDARTGKAPEDRTAAILTPRDADSSAKKCAAACEAALKSAQVSHVEPLVFDGTLEGAKSTLQARIESDPKLAIVLVNDEVGLSGVLDVRDKLEGKRPIVVGGYLRENPTLNEMHYRQTAAIVFRDIPNVAQEAFQAALRLVGGGTAAVPDLTKVPDNVQRFGSEYVDIPVDPATTGANPAAPK